MADDILSLNRSDFNAALRELADQGMDTTFLRQKYREQNSPFAGLLDYASRQQDRIAEAGRRPIMGGLLSKPVDAVGMEAITQAEFEPAAFISGLLSGGAQAIDAPAAAMRGDLTREEAEQAALGTAGLAFLGGSLAASPTGVLGANTFRRRAPTLEEAPMIVQHNISPEGLAISEQIGGIPMPSIGIAGAKAPLEGFGDITLMLKPEKIEPRRDLPVYPADAYTGRQPRADIEFSDKSFVEGAIAADPNFSHMRDSDYWMQSYNNFADNDRMMRTAQFGIDNKIANPKDYESFSDYVRDVQRKSGGFIYEDQLAPYAGLREYGDTTLMLSPEDPFTPSGNRRASKPYTAAEAFKRMDKSKAFQAGSEGHSGPGLMRAVLLDKFKSLDDIKANRGLLMAPGNEMSDVKDAWGSVVYDTIEDVAGKHFGGSHNRAEEYMTDLAMGRNVSWADATPEARDAATKALASLKKEAQGMPTEYFEAKPRSVAQIGDFDAAVVPEGSVDALEALRRAGIQNIKTYNPDIPGRTRADVIGGMDDFFFANASKSAGFLGVASDVADRGDTVLSMLKSGRGSDVTDDMLDMGDSVKNTQLNQYLFENYDLPMDEASRMARAAEQERTANQFHGAMGDYRNLRPSVRGKIGPGVYTAEEPNYANSFAGKVYGEDEYLEGGNVYPLMVKDNPAPDMFRTEAGALRRSVSDPFEGADLFSRYLDDLGFSGVKVGGEQTTVNPSNIRSRFARFDPRLAHLRNLSAGVGGLGLLSSMMPPEEQY